LNLNTKEEPTVREEVNFYNLCLNNFIAKEPNLIPSIFTCKADMKTVAPGKIIFNRKLFAEYYLMGLKVPAYFLESLPGQFVMLRVPGKDFPFLGRPFSIYSVYAHRNDTVIEMLYRVVGKGTALFSRMKKDEKVSVLGPLGRGFDIFEDRKNIILIAGGIGVAPLSFLAEYYRRFSPDKNLKISCYLGAETSDTLIGLERLEKMCSEVKVSTDDGSTGHHGLITELFDKNFISCGNDNPFIYACGPHQMMKSLAHLLERRLCGCQVSLEERMACGIGTCLGCTVVTKSDSGQSQFSRACKEGPVFDIKSIDWG